MPNTSTDRVRPNAARAPDAGFTLVELTLSVTLVTMLMLAMVQAFQGFGQQLKVLRETELDLRVEEGLVQLTHDVRNAWVVEQPAADALSVRDAYGRVTEYWLDGENLMVRRPSGAEGVLVAGVKELELSAQTVERLRPAAPATFAGSWWKQPGSGAAGQMLTVEQDLPVALGFTVSSDAPADADVVEGVAEQVLLAGLESLALTAAFAAPVEDTGDDSGAGSDDDGPPGKGDKGKDEDDDEDDDKGKGKDKDKDKDDDHPGKGKGKGKGSGFTFAAGGGSLAHGGGKGKDNDKGGKDKDKGKGGKDDDCDDDKDKGGKGGGKDDDCGPDDKDDKGEHPKKTVICHIPPGNPSNAHTLSVGTPAVAAHLAHGDTLGPCGGSGGDDGTPSFPDPTHSALHVELYEARAPNNGTPHGPLLASIEIPVSSLPAGSYTKTTAGATALLGDSSGCGKGAKKTVICHIPPGNPGNAHTLSVGTPAVAAHLAHGDTLGACGDAGSDDDTTVLVFDPPTQLAELDLSGLAASVEPGRAHTLVLRLEGAGTLLLASDPLASATFSGVAKVESGTLGFSPVPHAVPRTLAGSLQVSQTEATPVISAVTMKLLKTDGDSVSRSATVLGQAAIENPWLGAVPGELPSLELEGQ